MEMEHFQKNNILSSVSYYRLERKQPAVAMDVVNKVFTIHSIAIAIAKDHGIALVAGERVPGDGNCFITAVLSQEK